MSLQTQLPAAALPMRARGGAPHAGSSNPAAASRNSGGAPAVFLTDTATASAKTMCPMAFPDESPVFRRRPQAGRFDDGLSPVVDTCDMAYQPYQSPMTAYFDGPNDEPNFGMSGDKGDNKGQQQHGQQRHGQHPGGSRKQLKNQPLMGNQLVPPQQHSSQQQQRHQQLQQQSQQQQLQQHRQHQKQKQQQQGHLQHQDQQQQQNASQQSAMQQSMSALAVSQPALFAAAGMSASKMPPSTADEWQQMLAFTSCAAGMAANPMMVSRPAISYAAAAAAAAIASGTAPSTEGLGNNPKKASTGPAGMHQPPAPIGSKRPGSMNVVPAEMPDLAMDARLRHQQQQQQSQQQQQQQLPQQQQPQQQLQQQMQQQHQPRPQQHLQHQMQQQQQLQQLQQLQQMQQQLQQAQQVSQQSLAQQSQLQGSQSTCAAAWPTVQADAKPSAKAAQSSSCSGNKKETQSRKSAVRPNCPVAVYVDLSCLREKAPAGAADSQRLSSAA
eukprot:TRINITY_DN2963_c2_g1_i1.p1 TRINITY_DN2963_c2_g1~~TRINITY_DN2963_c2_g1_i1.p1  ORF type:complete len:497 (+),score=182.53 TRINITY_DN2963_c2_g1_i1:147-1637(+)